MATYVLCDCCNRAVLHSDSHGAVTMIARRGPQTTPLAIADLCDDCMTRIKVAIDQIMNPPQIPCGDCPSCEEGNTQRCAGKRG